MSSEYTVLKVNIFGTDYPVRGSTDPEYILRVARYVDQKMREVDQVAAGRPVLKVAILAALNIADELFREREQRERPLEAYEERVRRLAEKLAVVLGESSSAADPERCPPAGSTEQSAGSQT
ncbi:MAG: cell division protein ZapA [candidate division KSB1 bacterium]|nr:cell division protein ZapA [candidate division KSB1 bacterium]